MVEWNGKTNLSVTSSKRVHSVQLRNSPPPFQHHHYTVLLKVSNQTPPLLLISFPPFSLSFIQFIHPSLFTSHHPISLSPPLFFFSHPLSKKNLLFSFNPTAKSIFNFSSQRQFDHGRCIGGSVGDSTIGDGGGSTTSDGGILTGDGGAEPLRVTETA